MNPFWSYIWPVFVMGLILGATAGAVGFRKPRTASAEDAAPSATLRRKRVAFLASGAALSLALAALWHGPLGAADRFSTRVERALHETMVYYEMTQVSARLHHGPLTREVLFSGPADDFQRSELVRLITQLPGVRSATWAADGGGLPLIAEGWAVAVLGFLVGLLLAYVAELRRRYNSQWSW